MLAILKENKKNELLEWNGDDAEAIQTWIKPDLQGFSHLLECAPEAVKLSPALSEHMSSPPEGLQCPFDGWPFPLLQGQTMGQCLVFQQGSGFLCLLWWVFAERFGADNTSRWCHGSAQSVKFYAGAASHHGFLSSVTSRWCNIPCSPEWINTDFQYLLVGITYWILECLLCWCNTWIPCSCPVLGALCWY